MIFSDSKAIYEQISERVCDDIISGKYKADGRIPSARDIGANFQVNPNTVVKSFELLARNEIIYYRRGMGYYVSSNALKRILDVRRKNFLRILLPDMFRQMKLLGIDIGTISEEWEKAKRS